MPGTDLTRSDRRDFLRTAGVTVAGASGAGALLAGCGSGGGAGTTAAAAARHLPAPPPPPVKPLAAGALTPGDLEILATAQLAEALAVTTYTAIVERAPFFGNLQARFQDYFTAARDQEMSHYLLEQRLTRRDASAKSFFYPRSMFDDAQTTLNVLVGLEDAFIAAYLLGVRHFSSPALRVLAARIMGVESDHRVLARVVGPNVATKDKGPIDAITGFQKQPESVDPPNDNAYERTLGLTQAAQAMRALAPFADSRRAAKAGFDIARPFKFKPFKPSVAQPLGEFHSLAG